MKKRSYSKRNPNYMQSLDGSGPRKFIKVKSTNDYVDIHDPSGRMLDGYIRFVDGLQGGLYSVYLASEEVNDLGEPLEYYKTNESEYIPPSPFYVEPNPQKGTNKQKTRDALRMLRAALAEATDTESGRQPSKRHADFVMRLKAGIEELEKELKGSKRNPRYLVSRDGNEVGIFPGFNALMAINAARKIYGPGKYSSVKAGEAMFLGRGALQAEERLREETAARAARKAAAKRDKIQLPKKSRTRRNAAGKADILQQGVKAGLLPAGLVTDLQRLEEGRYSDDPKRRENLMSRAIILRSQLIYRNMIEKDPLNEAAQRALESIIVKEVQWQKQHKQNPLEKSAEHPIEVTRHYRSGGPNYLSPWQRAMAIGQEELFDTGIQMLPRVAERRAALFATRNPGATKRAYESGLKEATAAQLARLVRVGLRVGLTMAEIKKDVDATGRFTLAQIDRAMDQARSAEERLAKKQNPRRGSRRYRAASPYYGILGRPGKTSATAAARRLRDDYRYPFSLQKDGIEGHELSYKMIPGADTFDADTFDYALGYTKPGGDVGVYSRGASKRGTFGGWRWEMDPSKLLKQNPTPDQLLQSGLNIQIFATRNERARAFAESLPNGALKKALLSGLSKTMNALMADVTIFDMPDYMTTIRHILARQIPNKPKWSAARAQLLGFFDDRESNPSVKAIYQKFNGRPSRRSRNVAAPAGTPRDLAQLGRLRTLKTVDGRTWRFPGDRAPFLAADSRGKLHIVGGQYRANPAGEDCGEIDLIEYQTSKPHLGHDNETIYYHHMGEETGERPTLEITPAGELVIHGGAYRIEPEGLVN